MSQAATSHDTKQPVRGFSAGLHLLTLSAFALAWPLYDLLSRHPGFLVAHRSRPADLIALIALVSFGVPLALVVLTAVARRIWHPLGTWLYLLLVALLGAVASSWLLSKFSFLPGYAEILAALALGGLTAGLYVRWPLWRSFLSAVSPAIVVFPLVFVASPNVSKLLTKQVDPRQLMHEVDATAPVVMIVFDEFPTASLLNAERRIDPAVYPNFAALAEQATWYRNATSVHQLTGHALPAILTGNYQNGTRVPTFGDHPYNLFTLLGGSYELKAFEAFTQLCPEGRFGAFESEQFARRLQTTLSDLAVVYLHVTLPRELTRRLPSVSQTWRDFLGPSEEEVTRQANKAFGTQLEHFQKFYNALSTSDRPQCYFAHIYLPHQPWVYLPEGQLYMPPNALYMPGYIREGDRWGPSHYLVDQAYQRHLLQVRLVDLLLGRVIDRLKALDLYDPSLIVVTADHGVSFWPNRSRRNPAECPPEDILCVPLLIKAPHQREGKISDRNVELIDILPTIADLLNIELPWRVDGISAANDGVPERPKKRIVTRDGQVLTFDARLQNQYATLDRKLKLFDPGPDGLWRFGPRKQWLGRSVDSFALGQPWDVRFSIVPELLDWARLYANAFVPSLIAGTFHDPPTDRFQLAFAINGKIEAVAPCFHTDMVTWFSQAMVPPSAFREGKNRLQLFAVVEDQASSAQPRLHPLRVAPEQLSVSAEALQPVFARDRADSD